MRFTNIALALALTGLQQLQQMLHEIQFRLQGLQPFYLMPVLWLKSLAIPFRSSKLRLSVLAVLQVV